MLRWLRTSCLKRCYEMRRGFGKQKGSGFERELCKQLSIWVSGGAQKDLFWRSAMSGGRATVARGEVRQAGDVCSVAPEGHSLTDLFYIEAKFYADLALPRFFLESKGILMKFWDKALAESSKYSRSPLLVAKQNMYPAIVLMEENSLGMLTCDEPPFIKCKDGLEVILLDDLLNTGYMKKAKRERVGVSNERRRAAGR